MSIVIILILVGLLLFVVEFLLIPGVTVAGIAGIACLIGGVYWSYSSLGSTAGHVTLVTTIALTSFTIAMALRSKTWNRFMLKTSINNSIATEDITTKIKSGDEGVTISRLSPMGKVRINDLVVEAKSTGTYIDEKTEIIVVRFEGPRAIVKPKN